MYIGIIGSRHPWLADEKETIGRNGLASQVGGFIGKLPVDIQYSIKRT